MSVDAYALALIAGGFTVVGALIGTISGYRLAIHIERKKEHAAACAKLRMAFAPALSILYIDRHHGTHDRPPVDAKIKEWLLEHGAAIEEFRPFLSPHQHSEYQEAWEQYRRVAAQCPFSTAGEEWGLELEEGELLEKKIHAILTFAGKRL